MTTRRPDAPSNMMQDDDAPPASGLSSMQRAILTIQKMRTKIESLERARIEPIAIVGMACRFPGGADTPEAFFKILVEGVDAVTEVPPERWKIAAEEHSTDPEARAVRFGAFLRDVDLFDAGFFGISPREASKMDPQQRLLLEVTWEALERAGQLPERLVNSRTGVFLGIMTNDYAELSALAGVESEDVYTTTGNGHCFPAGRLSYTFGFQGPSVAVDTACSSSLVALHLACQSLRAGECNMAVAGGVNLMLVPSTTRKFAKTSALSPDGRCKTFDATANGFVRGEGCGMLVLKRLSDAEKDGDSILALIRGSAVNQDGRSTGLTTPNVLAQQAMLKQALENARVAPSDIGYVEAHGTGTPLGDPIEVEALKTVLGGPREKGSVCVLGAVKTNIGHLEAAAGIAGVMKVVLALQSELIPGNLHFRALNPRIDFRGTSLEIARAPMPWRSGMRPRFGGVSSFGLSGTNAHVVLEEAPRNLEEAIGKEASAYLLPISAKSPEGLAAHARAFKKMLSSPDSPRILDIVHTASSRRSHFEHRLVALGGSKEELAAALEAHVRGEAPAGVAQGKAAPARAKVVFVFSGQGSQWVGMGKKLYDEESAFRSVIDSCDALLMGRLGWSLLDELDSSEHSSRIGETQVAQPLIFAIQIALVELLRSWGVAPDAVIGHSVGEIAAAYIAGILSLDEAIRLVAIRGRIMQRATGNGKMVSVATSLSEARRALAGYEDRVAVAAVNDPGSVVISGDTAAIDELVPKLESEGIACRPLRVNYAFHSPQMDPLAAELVERLVRVDARRATLAMYSTVLSECVDGVELDVRYWGRNVRETVNLAGAVQSAIHDGYQLFLEVGPHPVLTSNVQQCLAHKAVDGLVVHSLRRNKDDRRALLEATGALYTRGCAVEWSRIVPSGGRVVPLVPYPWQRERYWLAMAARNRASSDILATSRGAHPLLGVSIDSSIQPDARIWQRAVGLDSFGEVRDHVVRGVVVVPAAAYIEMALAASSEKASAAVPSVSIEEVFFERMLPLLEDEQKTLELVISPEAEGGQFQISSRSANGAPWVRHARGTIRVGKADAYEGETLAALRTRCPTAMSAEQHEERMEALGLSYGPGFRVLGDVFVGSHEAIARIGLPQHAEARGARIALWDGAFQLFAALVRHVHGRMDGMTLLPSSIGRVRVFGLLEQAARVSAHLKTSEGNAFTGDVALYDATGATLASVEGLVLSLVAAREVETRDSTSDGAVFGIEWRPLALTAPSSARSRSPGVWVVFVDRHGIGRVLAGLLREGGDRVVEVSFREGGRGAGIDPTSPADYAAVLKSALAEAPCRGVVHLASVDAAEWEATTAETLLADQRTGSESVLCLAQSLVRMGARDTPRLWLATRGAQVVDAREGPPSVAQATVWGMARTIALEHPELQCTRIDFDATDDVATAARSLYAELSSNTREDQIAVRRHGRYVARLARVVLPTAPGGMRLEADSTYLITGGLGGLGLSLAKGMVERGARHLALVGRRPPSAFAAEVIRDMQEAGAEVLVLEGDVSRADDVASIFARIDERLPVLRGVVHAAAVLADHTMLELSGEHLRQVLLPKVVGAHHLHAATRTRELHWFVLYSSAASVLGSPGQANYAAANASVDALARARRAMGLPATSVQWGPFSDVGLAAAQENRGSRLAQRGLESFSPEEAFALLPRLFASPRADVACMRFDVRRWLEYLPQAAGSPFWSELAKERASSAPKPAAAQAKLRRAIEDMKDESERLAAIEDLVRRGMAKVLQIDPARVDLGAPFTSLGMDSLTSIELRNRLESSLELKLPATLLFTYANASALSSYLLGRLAPTTGGASKEKVEPTADDRADVVDASAPGDDDLLAAFDASMTSIKDEGLL